MIEKALTGLIFVATIGSAFAWAGVVSYLASKTEWLKAETFLTHQRAEEINLSNISLRRSITGQG